MKKIFAFSLVLLTWLCAGLVVYAQCGPRGCFGPSQSVGFASKADYRWVPIADEPEQEALYFRTLQVGAYNYATGFYRPIIGGRWGEPCAAPISPPFGARAGHTGSHLFGVTTSHLTGRERIWNSDGSYTRGQFETMLGAELRDDSRAGYVTAVGKTAVDTKKFLADWEAAKAKEPNAAKVRFNAWDYSSPVTKAMLAPNQLEKDVGFQRTGVVVLAQAAGDEKTGKAPARAWYDYSGPESLVEAVRAVDPNYDPNKAKWPTIPAIGNVPAEGYVVGGVAGVLGLTYLRRRKQ